MKILVLGVSGMAGHTIALYFLERGHEVDGYSTTPFKYCNNIIGNVFEYNKLERILLEGNYHAVINCIGILNQSAENNHADAIYLNSYLPHLLVNTLKNTNTKVIHMSTDCVFAGNTGPYHENSLPDGRTFYDRTKALGEINDSKNLTFRNSIIGPDMKVEGIGLFNWFMKQKDSVNGYVEAIWTGVTTLTLAKAMENALQQNLSGLYNLVNNDSISKFHLLQLFNRHFRNDMLVVNINNSLRLDKSLKNNRNDFTFKVPSYEQMLVEMKIWVDRNPQLYPHYK